MKVYFHEIKDQDLEFQFDETTPWVMDVIGALDERMDNIQRPPNWKPRSRATEVSFTLRRVEDLIHVTGKVKTQLNLLCSLCADGFQFPVQMHFHVLLTQSAIYAEAPRETSHKTVHDSTDDPDIWDADDDSYLDLDEDDDDDDEESAEAVKAPVANFNSSDFEVTVVTEPLADLKEILNEQIVLVLPMQPKPEKDEKDDCLKCGRKQVVTLPPQKELLKESPFNVLKNFKKKPDQT
ncbi:MAG: DUF177 domain-containing protein [Bdellovibrionales bacterium]|nr:DUF177 domain-containing protein [Oligoflexia bacterium]